MAKKKTTARKKLVKKKTPGGMLNQFTEKELLLQALARQHQMILALNSITDAQIRLLELARPWYYRAAKAIISYFRNLMWDAGTLWSRKEDK